MTQRSGTSFIVAKDSTSSRDPDAFVNDRVNCFVHSETSIDLRDNLCSFFPPRNQVSALSQLSTYKIQDSRLKIIYDLFRRGTV